MKTTFTFLSVISDATVPAVLFSFSCIDHLYSYSHICKQVHCRYGHVTIYIITMAAHPRSYLLWPRNHMRGHDGRVTTYVLEGNLYVFVDGMSSLEPRVFCVLS
jgi:hypothetical protein